MWAGLYFQEKNYNIKVSQIACLSSTVPAAGVYFVKPISNAFFADSIIYQESRVDIIFVNTIERLLKLIKDNLTSREYRILELRYGIGGKVAYTQREVAKYLKISRSYVSRIEKKALEELKNGFGGAKPDFS